MAKCIECSTIMKTGIAIQKSPHESIEWVCQKCWDLHDYGTFMQKKLETCHD